MVSDATPAEPASPADRLKQGVVPELVLFVVAAVALAVLCWRVSDWAVMTDELLYERLALSFVDGAFLPTLHGEHVDVYGVLYPFLLMPVFAVVDLPDAIRAVHGLNGVLFASAAVPTWLLARELALTRLAALGSALFAAALPWSVIGGFVMTESAAYPAALWALLAIHRAVVLPAPRRDVVALGAILVATLARPQLAALGVVLLAAAAVHEARLHRWRAHAVAFGVAALAVPVLLLGGAGLLGSYSPAIEGDVLSVDAFRSALMHVNVTAVALGIVPLILGGGWAIAALVRPPADPERSAFAGLVVAAVTVLAVESGSVVVRFGLGLDVKDRYLFYIAPILFLATVCALEDPRPRIAGVLGLTALFVLTVGLEDFKPVFGVNVDSPASSTHEALTSFGNDVGLEPAELLAIAGGLLGLALVLALRRLPRRQLTVTVLVALVAFVFAETAYTWNRLFESSGPSGRQLTAAQADQLSWVDNAVEDGLVAMFPYSFGQDWYPSAVAFWDVEFWNSRVHRAYRLDGYFTYTPESFPTPSVRIDPRTGLFVGAGTLDFIVRTPLDARFGPAGPGVAAGPQLELVDLEVPLRAQWLTLGLDPDGWTRPTRAAVLRIYPPAGAATVSLIVGAPEVDAPRQVRVGPQSFTLGSTERRELALEVCVPEGGYADVPIEVEGSTAVRGIPVAPPFSDRFREVGVQLSQIRTVATGRTCQT
jgi:hypothetical protein